MPLNINTTDQQYISLVNGIDTLDSQMIARKDFMKLPKEKKILWLQRDPLLKKALLFAEKYASYTEAIREELEND